MKKRTDYDEFLRQLEEAIEDMLDEILDNISIDLSICVYPCIQFPEIKNIEHSLPVDILETENSVHVVIALPGIQKRNIKLRCTGKLLEITAKNNEKILNERIQLPAKVNRTGMKSTYKNGILEVVLNKPKRRK